MSQDIKVSIICNTYNHEDYIKDALDSFLMQETDFAYEILIHDDASTDKTADIVREYEKNYPELIKPIYQTENMYSKKLSITKSYQCPRVKGKYIAFCEGDDYWTDPKKLQKQYNALEKHPNSMMCVHAGIGVNAKTKEKQNVYAPFNENTIINVEQAISGGGDYLITSSFFFRKEMLENQPEFLKNCFYDYTMQIQGALNGGIIYLNNCMSAYRQFSKNSWTSRNRENNKALVDHVNKIILMFNFLNKETEYKYSEVIHKKINQYQFYMYRRLKQFDKIKEMPYKTLYNDLPFKTKIIIKMEEYCPQVIVYIQSIKRGIKKIWEKI